MILKLRFTLLVLLLSQSVFSQTKKQEIPVKIDATLKTRYEWATETTNGRFSVRNSRLGLSGDLSSLLSYRAQLELSSDGKFEVLDLYANLKLASGFDFSFGQTSIPLFNASQTTPSQMVFANRSFLGKFNTSTRDIGFLSAYKGDVANIPIMIQLGLFNGTTINNPKWTNKLSYNGRIMVGEMTGWRASAKFTRFPLSTDRDFFICGFDIRYAARYAKIEAEAMNRHNYFNDIDRFTSYIETSVKYPLKGDKLIKAVIPALRWDGIGENLMDNGLDASRLTVGISLGLTNDPFNSLIRLDVEKYFIKNEISDFSLYDELDSDKITIELLIVF